jgi:hypothetical protein
MQQTGLFKPLSILSLVALFILVASAGLQGQAREDPFVRYPAETRREPQVMKNLLGQVLDQNNNGLARAMVHLKNKRSLEVKTRITDPEGNYIIRGLDRDTDYEVHAEFKGASSNPKNVSSFDDRDEIYLVLEIISGK